MLSIKNLSVSIQEKTIIHSLSYTFEKGKIYAIMGPNGSGKSTLASSIMGHPSYIVGKKSKVNLNGNSLMGLSPDERSRRGMFLSFQTPLSLSGVTIFQLMRYALDGKMDPLSIRKMIQKTAHSLHIPDELLTRSLNDGFSGGEKKKMEVLQAVLLNPSLLFFDEIDTGVDVDALKTIGNFLKKFHSPEKTYIIITHYQRILTYLKPDRVLVLVGGKLVAEGDEKLVEKIESDGYESLKIKTQNSKLKNTNQN